MDSICDRIDSKRGNTRDTPPRPCCAQAQRAVGQRRREKGEKDMGIRAQAEQIGFRIVGTLERHMELEPTHSYQCFLDEAQNCYILRRGILTIVPADGSVY